MRIQVLGLALIVVACQRSAPQQASAEASPLAIAQRSKTGLGVASSSAAKLAPRPPLPLPAAPQSRVALQHRLKLTLGQFEGTSGLTATASKIRGVEVGSTGDRASLKFRYEGPSLERSTLRSGTVREQLGLKLRARDGCNLVYVMWRLGPVAKLVVSIKLNPNDSTHGECESRGYTNVRPELEAALPSLSLGEERELAAEIRGDALEAKVDGRTVWRGHLPSAATELRGPAGFRSDNVRWTLVGFETGPK